AVATHFPVSAFTNEALTEELPISKPNKYLFAINDIYNYTMYSEATGQKCLSVYLLALEIV
ncbi:MAG: hypothetical protein K2J00_08970, partial [Bacteroidaceae bacterium]|nr:hypothetical protein [Bacteroidaceae bacterium]